MVLSSFFVVFFIIMQANQLVFILALLLLYLFFNACRRLFVSAAPLLLHEGLLDGTQYGFISSISSMLFGITRFCAFYLMEWFSMDIYVSAISTLICCLCIVLGVYPSLHLPIRDNTLLTAVFVLLQASLGLPFACSSVVIRTYIHPKCN